MTVYNQFGSRRGLLEAVLDQLAQRRRLVRLPALDAEFCEILQARSDLRRQALTVLIKRGGLRDLVTFTFDSI